MSSQSRKQPTKVDEVQHYYAVSVSYTRSQHVELRLTQFHKEPRHLTTTTLGTWEGRYRSAADAALWINAATERWVAILAEQAHQDSGQGTLFEVE